MVLVEQTWIRAIVALASFVNESVSFQEERDKDSRQAFMDDEGL